MPKGRPVTLVFPAGGLDRRGGYQSQRPFTTARARNVRPDDAIEKRERGGSRPGLIKHDRLAHGTAPGKPIRMLSSVNIVPTDGAQFWEDLFQEDAINTESWSKPPWLLEQPDVWPESDPEYLSTQYQVPANYKGIVRSALATPPIDTSQAYWLELDVVPTTNEVDHGNKTSLQQAYHGSYAIWLRMNDDSADTLTDVENADFRGIRVNLEFVARPTDQTVGEPNLTGAYTITVEQYSGGTAGSVLATATGTPDPAKAQPGTLAVLFTPGGGAVDNVKVHWDGSEQIDQDLLDELTHSRFGIAHRCDTIGPIRRLPRGHGFQEPDFRALIDGFSMRYFTATTEYETNRSLLVAAASQNIYVEDSAGNMVLGHDGSGAVVNVTQDHPLSAVQRLQKLYIADFGDIRKSATTGSVKVPGSGIVEDTDGVDFSDPALAIDINNDVFSIYNESTDTAAGEILFGGSYKMTTLTAVDVTLANFPSGVLSGETFSYRIERGPKIYDPHLALGSRLTLWNSSVPTGKGAVPGGCPLIAWYMDRMVLAGALSTPHAWFMSRVSDPLDWDYGQTDAGRAVASDLEDAGKIGVPLTALIAGGTDYLVFGTEESLWVMRGDPAQGGFIDNLSHSIGIVSKQAWARGPSGEIVFMSKDGLYAVAPGGDQFPTPISKERLPRKLRGIDSGKFDVLMAYDVDAQGFHIHILPKETTSLGQHWWLDWETKGFWPVDFTLGHEPRSIYRYEAVGSTKTGVLLGGQDGFIRRYNRAAGTDDNVAFPNFVFIGPLKMSNVETDGMLTEMNAVMAIDSGPVTWTLHSGETAEAALRAPAFAEGVLGGGRNATVRPRIRGHAVYLKLTGESGQPWAMEEIGARIRELGKARVS